MIDTEEVSTPLVDLNWWQNNPAERDEVFADL